MTKQIKKYIYGEETTNKEVKKENRQEKEKKKQGKPNIGTLSNIVKAFVKSGSQENGKREFEKERRKEIQKRKERKEKKKRDSKKKKKKIENLRVDTKTNLTTLLILQQQERMEKPKTINAGLWMLKTCL